MSGLRFRCLDLDETTELLDLTELNNGAQAGYGIRAGSFDLGGGELEDEYLRDNAYDGAIQLTASRPESQVTLDLYLYGLDPDDLRARLRLLAQLLDRPHVWEYQPEDGSQPLLIDAFRSPKPKLGGETSHGFLVHNYFIGSPTLVIRRQAGLRVRRQISVLDVTITNAPGENFVKLFNAGSMRSPVKMYLEPLDPLTKLVGVVVARCSVGDLDERGASFLGRSLDQVTYPAGSSTTGAGTHAESSAADGFVAVTTFPDKALLPRWQDILTPVDPTALEGPSRVRFCGWAAAGAIYTLQLRWGLVAPLAKTGELVTLDLTSAALTGSVRFDLDMGLVSYDRLGASLILQGFAASDTIGKTISWDTYKLMPAGEATITAREPSWLGQVANQTEWDPASLVIPTHIDKPSTDAKDDGPANSIGGALDIQNNRVQIGRAARVNTGDHKDRTNEAVGTAPNLGFQLPVGTYEATAALTVVNKDKEHGQHAELRVRNLSDTNPATADRAVTVAYSTKGIQETVGTWKAQWSVDNPSDLWQLQIVYTHDRDPVTGEPMRHKVYIDGLSMGAVRAIAGPEQAVLDGFTESAYGLLTEGKSHALTPGVPEAESGWNLYALHLEELNVPGSAGADPRGPLPACWSNREYRLVMDLGPLHDPE